MALLVAVMRHFCGRPRVVMRAVLAAALMVVTWAVPEAVSWAADILSRYSPGPAGWEESITMSPPPVRRGDLRATNLPRPTQWRGNIRNFDLHVWQGDAGSTPRVAAARAGGGSGGRTVLFLDEPVLSLSRSLYAFGLAIGWWYWCDPYQEYATICDRLPCSVWESGMPRE